MVLGTPPTEAVRRHPPSIDHLWSLIVGFDEFTPGNKLQCDNRRKTMVLSFTFKELGQMSLCKALVWHTPVCLRTSVITQVEGEWTHCLSVYLQRHLLGPCGLATSGVPVVLADGRPTLIFARLTNLLSDGDGLRMALDWRGHASLKACFRHYNVFKKDSCSNSRWHVSAAFRSIVRCSCMR